jgi:hypothetical protein
MKTIIWDIDDVLNNLMEEWYYWSGSHDTCNYFELTDNPPYKSLNISRGLYLDSLDTFRFECFSELKPTPQILKWFEENGHEFNHVALTSTPLATAHISAQWVMRHFGQWIRNFAFIPSERKGVTIPSYHKSKADWINYFGKGDIFIDDNQNNTDEVFDKCVNTTVILYKQPWNDGVEIDKVLEILNKEI